MKWIWLSAAALALLTAGPARATTLAPMNLAELARAAHAVVRARCLSSESRWEKGEIWTFARFAALESFKGDLAAEFTLRVLGGRVGAIESIVSGAPRFRPGGEFILFLEPSPDGGYGVTGWIEGAFRVWRDAAGAAYVTQESAAPPAFDPQTRRFEPQGIRAMPLDSFRRRLLQMAAGAPAALSPPEER